MSVETVIVREPSPERMALARRLLFERGCIVGGEFIDLDDAALAIAEAFEHGRRFGAASIRGDRVCRVCGCTDLAPCHGLACAWASKTLCTTCVPFLDL